MSDTNALNRFKTHITQNKLRVTKQRLAVFSAATKATEHFTAEQLLDLARKIDRSVSRATVYRTLPILVEAALLREVDIGKNTKFYHPVPNDPLTQFAQVICADCDRIFEIQAPFMQWYGSTVSSKLNLTPISQRLQVTASCNALQQKRTCPNKKHK